MQDLAAKQRQIEATEQKLRSLVSLAEEQPHRALEAMRLVLRLLGVPPRVGARERDYRPLASDYVQAIPSPTEWVVVPAAPAVAASTTAAPIQVPFKWSDGYLIGFHGSSVDFGPPAVADLFTQSITAVNIAINASKPNIITNGDTLAYATFADLFPAGAGTQPMLRRIYQNDVVEVTYQNQAPPGGPTVMPRLVFGFWSTGRSEQ